MTDTTRARVRSILLNGARDAYTGFPEHTDGIPVDRRCSGCGVDRPCCDDPMCSRRPYDDYEEESDE